MTKFYHYLKITLYLWLNNRKFYIFLLFNLYEYFMKAPLQKSPIPDTHAFVAKSLIAPNFDPNWHFHTEYQLFVVLKGTGTKFIGDSVKHFKEGDIVFTGPNLPHLWRSDNEEDHEEEDRYTHGIVIYFHEDFLGQALLQKEELIKIRHLFLKSTRGMELYGKTAGQTQAMMVALLEMEGFERVLQLLKILNILASSSEYHLLSSPGYTNSLKQADTERMNQVHTYVMKNFRKDISLDKVAAIANMTPSSFSRYFKLHANKTFSTFLSEIRIGYACKLLIEDKINVSQACYESGYQTLSNFNKQFKAITHRTPIAYKKEYEQKIN